MKFYSFLLICVLFSCKNNTITATTDTKLPEDFTAFYERFHQDSQYQMKHIIFPLEGMPANDDGSSDDFKWSKEDWEIHQEFTNPNGEYNRELYPLDSTIVIEFIRLKNNQFGMERRYAKSDGEWFLIYYAAMNKLIKNESNDSIAE